MQGFFLGFSWLSLHPTRAQVEPQPRQGSTAPNPHPALRRGRGAQGDARPAAFNIHRQTSKFIHAVDAGFTTATVTSPLRRRINS